MSLSLGQNCLMNTQKLRRAGGAPTWDGTKVPFWGVNFASWWHIEACAAGAGGAPPAAPRVPAVADDGRESRREREKSDRTIKGSAAARDLRTTQPPHGPLAARCLPSPNLDSPSGWYPKPLHHYLFTQYQAVSLSLSTHTAFNC